MKILYLIKFIKNLSHLKINKSLYEQAKGYFQKNNAKSNNVIEPALTKD